MMKNSVLKTGAGALAATALGVGLAACGSSAAKGIQTVPGDGLTQAAVTATTATSAVTTPSSGPLATRPVPTKGSSPAPTSLVKKVMVAGNGPAAASGDDITVNFYGWDYATGVPFSGGSSWTSSTQSTPYGPVELGAGEVIKGWDQGLVGVKAGSRVELIIPPKLAYAGTSSPLKADTLTFVIDVLKVTKGTGATSAG